MTDGSWGWTYATVGHLPFVGMATSSASLNRSSRKNWVEKAGNLPPYVRKVARAIERERGIPLDKAIPYAIGRITRWAAGGDGVTAATKAKAAAALAAWEALKAKSGKLRESAEPPNADDLDMADVDLIALAEQTEDPLAVVEALSMPVTLGDFSLLEATAGERLSNRGRDAKAKDKRRTRGGGDADFEREHPRNRSGEWTIKQGAKGDDVRTIQRRVGAKADGNFGAMTRAAVMAFQRKHGLKVDGIVGHQTAVAIAGNLKGAKDAKVGALKDSDRAKLRALRKPKGRVREALSMKVDAGDLSLLEAGFVEGDHPRDLLGRFRRKVAALKPGEAVSLPDGVEVRLDASHGLYHVGGVPLGLGGRGGGTANLSSAAVAATRAAQISAQSTDPRSLGGATRYRSLKALEDNDPRPRTTRQAQRFNSATRRAQEVAVNRHRRVERKQWERAMAKAMRESTALSALRFDSDLRLIESEDANAIHEEADLALVETTDGHATLTDLSLVESTKGDAVQFNADGTVDFVIIRPCHGRGVANAIYESAMLERDAHVFTGWPVYDNHESPEAARARRGIPRPPSELAGEIRESFWDPDFTTPEDAKMGYDRGAVIGRFMLTEDMEKLVRRLPRSVKTSVNAQATGKKPVIRNGRRGMLVEGIVNDPENCSVDLVTKAGAGGQVASLYRQLAVAA